MLTLVASLGISVSSKAASELPGERARNVRTASLNVIEFGDDSLTAVRDLLPLVALPLDVVDAHRMHREVA